MINLIPFKGSMDDNGNIIWKEIIQNILIFVPLGIYINMVKSDWPFSKKVIFIISVTLTFEIVQYAFALGKSDMTDILDNTLGGILGIGLYFGTSKIFKSKTNKIISIIALISTVFVVVSFSYLFYLSSIVMRSLSVTVK